VVEKAVDPDVLSVVHVFVSVENGQFFLIDGFCPVATAVHDRRFYSIGTHGHWSSTAAIVVRTSDVRRATRTLASMLVRDTKNSQSQQVSCVEKMYCSGQ
jgi:hypothetical protein